MAVKMIEYTNFKYVQGPYILFARLLVLAAVPAAFDEGLNVLAFMQNFAPNINKHLSNLWDQRIPLLQHYLEQTKVKQRVLVIEMEMKAPVFFKFVNNCDRKMFHASFGSLSLYLLL